MKICNRTCCPLIWPQVNSLGSTPFCIQIEKDEVKFEKDKIQFEKYKTQFEKYKIQFEKDKAQFEKYKNSIWKR